MYRPGTHAIGIVPIQHRWRRPVEDALDAGAQLYIHQLMDGFEWDPRQAAANLAKHRVDFADAALALEDPRALTRSRCDGREALCDARGGSQGHGPRDGIRGGG